jgi:mRNA interferase MazF
MARRHPYVPDRGDVVRINFDPQIGHEQKGRRPALVISPRAYNQKVGLGIFCPITEEAKGYPFEVAIPKRPDVRGVILSDQIKSLDWVARNTEKICTLPDSMVSDVLDRIAPLIDPDR